MEKINNLIINIKDKKDNIDSLPGYEEVESQVKPQDDTKLCWNCSKCLLNKKISIPHSFINDIFYTNGDFCSYGCALRYIMDTYSSNELWSRVSLLQMYYKISTGDNSKIKPVPNKKSLKVFGGSLTYEEYHSNNNESVDTFIPPILPINNMEYSHENKKNNKKKNTELRLYRKNPIKNKNDIYNTMQLTVD
tara:strand:+ start:534 stop:1109 length:576 start_codon:yes stop_codon:yes gene_type:complete